MYKKNFIDGINKNLFVKYSKKDYICGLKNEPKNELMSKK
jgi:hypothetical protein